MGFRIGGSPRPVVGSPAGSEIKAETRPVVERAGAKPTQARTGFENRTSSRKSLDEFPATAAVQQRSVYDLGTDEDPARLALRDAIWERLETPTSLRSPVTPRAIDLKQLANELATVASARQSARLQSLAAKDGRAATNMADVLNATIGLSKDLRNSFLQTVVADAGGVAGAVVAGIATSATFTALSAEQKTQLAKVLSRLDERGLSVMGALFEHVPEALGDSDSAKGTLLSNLAALASQPLNAALIGHTSTEQLLASALGDVMNPNRVEQGNASACTVASMQFELVADEPAEYLRLLVGLTGTRGTAPMKGGGSLRIGPGDADPAALAGRSVSQAIFQSAALEYANGRFANFDPVSGSSTSTRTGAPVGLKPENQQALLEKLFGVGYSVDRLFSESEANAVLAKLQGFDARGAQNRPIIVDIDQGKFSHAVTLEAVSTDRIVYRDPFGVLRSMEASMFPRVAVAVHLPTDLKRA